MNNWGASNSTPDLAFRLNGNAGEWNLVTHARRVVTSGDQNVTWSFNAQTAELQLDAQLTTTAGGVFQYRLEAPPKLHVDSIVVLAEGAKHVARWSQDPDGRITVFLTEPVSGRHEFQLRGQMPLPKKRRSALPQVRLHEVTIQNLLINLYRRPDVLVEVAGVAGLGDVKTTDDAGPGDLGRPVRSFYADSAAASPVLVTIKPNRPRVRGEQVTQVACEEDQCRTTCAYRLQVSEGVLDSLELDVPASWKDGMQTSPAMTATFAAASEERASLVLSPSAAISGNVAFTLTGPPAPSRDLPSPRSR